MPTESSLSGVVSEAERASFVLAVLTGKLSPDRTQVAYHFAGKLDDDVVDVVLDSISDPSEAVSALAGMSSAADGDSGAATAKKISGATSTINSEHFQAGGPQVSNRRQVMTLEAMQAHQRSTVLTPPPSEDQARAGCEGGDTGGGGGGGGTDADLEKVAQFIASYAGEQEAAAKAVGIAVKPPASPFLVPRGTVVPPNRKLQVVIINTAAKTVEISGFEVFMKIQHGKEALFHFLGTDHALHSYYLLAKRHAQDTLMKGGNARGSLAPAPGNSQSPKTEDPDVLKIMQMLGGVGP